jgi:hypothetical protein
VASYFRSTVEIVSDFDPSKVELADLARDATDGDSICVSERVEPIDAADLPDSARSFFDEL